MCLNRAVVRYSLLNALHNLFELDQDKYNSNQFIKTWLLIACDIGIYVMRLVVRKPAFCIWENKEADQLCGDREADQRLCFRYTDSTIPLLLKSEISSL